MASLRATNEQTAKVVMEGELLAKTQKNDRGHGRILAIDTSYPVEDAFDLCYESFVLLQRWRTLLGYILLKRRTTLSQDPAVVCMESARRRGCE